MYLSYVKVLSLNKVMKQIIRDFTIPIRWKYGTNTFLGNWYVQHANIIHLRNKMHVFKIEHACKITNVHHGIYCHISSKRKNMHNIFQTNQLKPLTAIFLVEYCNLTILVSYIFSKSMKKLAVLKQLQKTVTES